MNIASVGAGEQSISEQSIGDLAAFHGEGNAGGCGESSASGAGVPRGGAAVFLLGMLIAFGRRRAAGWIAFVLIGLSMSACSCGEKIEGESDPGAPNQVQPGPVGRWVSADADSDRTVVVAYERKRGDLVISELREDGEPRYVAVAGVTAGPVSRDPNGYRGGVEASGPDVGAWASVRLRSGKIIVAHQDRDRHALTLAYQSGDAFDFVDIDVPVDDYHRGGYASLAVGKGGRLGVAYQSVLVEVDDSGTEMVTSELRFASSASPEGPWTVEIVAAATAPHADRLDVPAGVGLWASLVFQTQGPSIAHYDSISGDLVVASREACGG